MDGMCSDTAMPQRDSNNSWSTVCFCGLGGVWYTYEPVIGSDLVLDFLRGFLGVCEFRQNVKRGWKTYLKNELATNIYLIHSVDSLGGHVVFDTYNAYAFGCCMLKAPHHIQVCLGSNSSNSSLMLWLLKLLCWGREVLFPIADRANMSVHGRVGLRKSDAMVRTMFILFVMIPQVYRIIMPMKTTNGIMRQMTTRNPRLQTTTTTAGRRKMFWLCWRGCLLLRDRWS